MATKMRIKALPPPKTKEEILRLGELIKLACLEMVSFRNPFTQEWMTAHGITEVEGLRLLACIGNMAYSYADEATTEANAAAADAGQPKVITETVSAGDQPAPPA